MKSEILPVEIKCKNSIQNLTLLAWSSLEENFFLNLWLISGQNEMAVKGKTKKKLFEMINEKATCTIEETKSKN